MSSHPFRGKEKFSFTKDAFSYFHFNKGMHHSVEIVIAFYYPFLSTFRYLSGQAYHLSLNIKIHPPPEEKELFWIKLKKKS